MNVLITILSSTLDKLNRRIVKYKRYGKSDIQTSIEVSPYGVDSNPVKDIVAVFAETNENGKTVVIGYLNKNQKAKPGEFRNYATNANGVEVFYTWMKDDGTMEIGGNQNYAVRFNELKEEFNKLKDDHNELVQKWNAFCGSYAPGSPTTTGTPPTLATSTVTANSSNIDNSKNDKVKTI